MISKPVTASIKVVCFNCSSLTDCSTIFFRGFCIYQDVAIKINTIAKVIYPKGPPIKNITIMNIITKGKSTMAAIVADVKNSLTLSYDWSLDTNCPVEAGFAFILIFSKCENILFDITVSARFPAIPKKYDLTIFIIKSNTIIIEIPINKAHRVSIALLGKTLSYTFIVNKGVASINRFINKEIIATCL